MVFLLDDQCLLFLNKVYAYSWQRLTIPRDGNYTSLKRFPGGTIPLK